MFSFLSLILTGFVLGMEHALDADHVAAISTLVRRQSLRHSTLLGIFWGFGHTLTLMLAGIAVLLFKFQIPVQIAKALEMAVGAMLILLGVLVLRQFFSTHAHKHRHGKLVHSHIHNHVRKHFRSHQHQSFAVGMVHGLAGSAALILLVLAGKEFWQGIAALGAFSIGTILSMALMSTLIGLPFAVSQKYVKFQRTIMLVAGIASIGLGLRILALR